MAASTPTSSPGFWHWLRRATGPRPGATKAASASAPTATAALAPAAGLVSTAEDLALFGASCWTRPGLLSAQSWELQRQRDSAGYGLGVVGFGVAGMWLCRRVIHRLEARAG